MMKRATHLDAAPRRIAAFVATLTVAAGAVLAGEPPFEDFFEEYDTTGGAQLLTPQSDYTSDAPQVVHVISLDPIEGQSARHVGDSSGLQEFDLFSPTFLPTYGKIQCLLRVNGNARYQIATFDTHSGYLNTRVELSGGAVTVHHGEKPSLALTSTTTGGDIMPGIEYLICIEVTNAGELFVYLDDELIFEGLENNFAQFGVPGRIGQWGIWATSDLNGFVDGTGDTLTIDEVEMHAAPCQQDLSADGVISALDIATLLSLWGSCADQLAPCPADFDNNGAVNAADLATLLSEWGACE